MLQFQSDGDAEAFAVLFERHKGALNAFLSRLSRNPDIAEEISQRAWLKLLEVAERGAYKAHGNAEFRTYLYTLARNTYYDEFRKTISRTAASRNGNRSEPSSDSDPAGEFDNEQLRKALNRALSQLPLEQREVIAFWAAGMKMNTIAEIVGVSRHTAIGRKRYALDKLRDSIGALAETD